MNKKSLKKKRKKYKLSKKTENLKKNKFKKIRNSNNLYHIKKYNKKK